MATETIDLLAEDLRRLLTSPLLTGRERATGQGILRRISAPVRVALHGPETAMATGLVTLFQSRTGQAFERTRFSRGGPFEEADILLWCTRNFSPEEQANWDGVPDALKDHSYLVSCASPSHLSAHLAAVATDGFIGHHCFTTLDDADATRALEADLVRHIEGGGQAASDAACLFVRRHRAKMSDIPPSPEPDVETPGPGACPTGPAAGAPRRDILAAPATVPDGAILTDATPPASEDMQPVLAQAVSLLSGRSEALQALIGLDARAIGPRVLEECRSAAEELVALFGTSWCRHPDQAAMIDGLSEAADHIVLMSLENEVGAAADAVTVLLQVRKDLSVCLAA